MKREVEELGGLLFPRKKYTPRRRPSLSKVKNERKQQHTRRRDAIKRSA